MIRTLAIIAGAGFLTFIVCLTSVLALGGPEIVRDGFVIPAVLEHIEQGDDYEGSHAPRVEKTVEWAGADALTIDLAADVTIVRGDKPGLVINGTQKDVDRVKVDGGRIYWADEGRERHVVWHDRTVKITVTAPDVRKVTINGSADVTMHDYDEPDLTIAISGSGDVDASGRTDSLTVTINGSGDVDLRALTARKADLTISGSGDIQADASDEARVAISGAGDVSLTRRPARFEYDVAGSGDLTVAGQDIETDPDRRN